MLVVRQLMDLPSSTWTYLVHDAATGDAVLIDPVYEQHLRDAALLRELGLTLRATIDTHIHADHVTGAWLMKAALGSEIALSAGYAATGVDRGLLGGDVVTVGKEPLRVIDTPGHTGGCITLAGEGMVFTGDCLMIRSAGRTDFQSGSARTIP